jgi:hypothetical protein
MIKHSMGPKQSAVLSKEYKISVVVGVVFTD